MTVKVYSFVKDSINFKAVLPSGLDTLTGVSSYRLKFKKPDETIVMKNGTSTDFVTGTLNIGFTVVNGDFDQEGIYDYEFADTTSGIDRKGKLLQFTVTREIQ